MAASLRRRAPFVSATFAAVCAAYQAWGAITNHYWPSALVAVVLAIAAAGLWSNRRWAQWPVYAITVLTVGQWAIMANQPILRPTNHYVLASYIPGIILIGTCAAVCAAIALHFRRRPT